LQAGGTITSPASRTVTLKCTGIIDTNGFGVSIAGVMNGAARLTKTGLGNLTLTGANTYSGATTIIEGSLLVSSAGSLASSGVTVNSGANFVYNNNTTGFAGTVRVSGTLGGSGRFLGTIEGGGQVGPGNSPGILTAAATDPTEGMDYNFEFTSTGMPTYSNNTASVNDVLRLTDATTPFTASLTSPANVGSKKSLTSHLRAPVRSAGKIRNIFRLILSGLSRPAHGRSRSHAAERIAGCLPSRVRHPEVTRIRRWSDYGGISSSIPAFPSHSNSLPGVIEAKFGCRVAPKVVLGAVNK